MPNWCANRQMFNGIKSSDALKTWIAGVEVSLHRRNRKECIWLFLVAVRGYCAPDRAALRAIPAAGSYNVAADNQRSVCGGIGRNYQTGNWLRRA
ncbi:hypothetical protein F9N64_19610 [Salmonella enterica]|nr:hypothetical protein [Salmonella enterica subsp. salamae]ECI2502415.1 hypothetical protein [Salmonella enterica subsp. enterica serovar Enteritidis]EDQ1421349.1 hypothetical protein [Salmonella enterica]ECC8833640.1 hypothetical protein [Salmonella enterica subsp. salamae]EDE1796284.1 hypothetical protein [Salmonella enterica subsp. enterica serovar Enteritidis]